MAMMENKSPDSACFWLALSQRFGGLWTRKGAGHPNGGLFCYFAILIQWRVPGTHEIIARRSAGQPFWWLRHSPEPSSEGALGGGF